MSIIAQVNPTLMDLKAGWGATKESAIVEILASNNEMLDDMTWVEANDKTGHKSVIRTGLPRGAWRLLNYGIPAEKAATANIRDTCGMLESYAEADAKMVAMAKDPKEYRANSDYGFIEGMSQTMAETLIYGNTRVTPESFTGLAPRFNDIATTTPANARNIINAGGTGNNNTSIWLVLWHPDTVFGIYPEGSKGGLQIKDLGQNTKEDGGGLMHEVMRTHYSWDAGLVVKDWRAVVRIANIDVTALSKDASAGADLFDLLAQAAELLPLKASGRVAIYANRTISAFLRRQSVKGTNVRITTEQQGGKRVTMFDGMPIRRVDAILNTEARVV